MSNKVSFSLEDFYELLTSKLNAKALGNLTKNSIRILVIGKTRVGKSTFINTVFGKLVAQTDALTPTTKVITAYRSNKGHQSIVLYDTPGFAESYYKDNIYIQKMREELCNCDIILVVLPHEFEGECYEQPLKLLEEWGGERLIKERCVFAISKSDLVVKAIKERETKFTSLDEYLSDYATRMNENIFKKMKYKINGSSIKMISIKHASSINLVLMEMVYKVSDQGFWGLITFIEKKHRRFFFDDLSTFGRKLNRWLDNSVPPVISAVLKGVLATVGIPLV